MRIGISAFYRLQGGALTHLRHVLEAWTKQGVNEKHAITLFTRADGAKALKTSIGPGVHVQIVDSRCPWGTMKKLFWEQIFFPRAISEYNLDVLFCTGNLVPLLSQTPMVVAFQNAAPFCSSLTPQQVGLKNWISFKILGLLMRLSARKAKRIIFVSKYFRNLFVERYGFPLDKGDVIYHGRDSLTFPRPNLEVLHRYGLRQPYMLFVSHLYPYKNILELLTGFARALSSLNCIKTQLVLVGEPINIAYYERLKRFVKDHNLTKWVIFTGSVHHEIVGALMAHCHAFVFQSTCENCPNSLIEALAAGLPIACSKAGVLPEIAGDAVLYFEPSDPKDIARALINIAEDEDLCSELSQRASLHAKRFPSWSEVGQMTLNSLTRAVNSD